MNPPTSCRWQQAVQSISQEVAQQFARSGGGRDVLQVRAAVEWRSPPVDLAEIKIE